MGNNSRQSTKTRSGRYRMIIGGERIYANAPADENVANTVGCFAAVFRLRGKFAAAGLMIGDGMGNKQGSTE